MGIRSRLHSALVGRTQDDIELAYLNKAVSRTDLERRQVEVDRGLLRPRRFGY